MANILIIEDNQTMREGMTEVAAGMGHRVTAAPGGKEGIASFRAGNFDLVLTDLKMGALDGMQVLKEVHRHRPGVPVMIVTAYGSIEGAVEAMREGAFDFVTKPVSPAELKVKIERALGLAELEKEKARLEAENLYLKGEEGERYRPDEIVGNSQKIREVFARLQKIAPTDSSVIISGESGTGKELLARAIHRLSPRNEGPFIKIDCGAYPETLIESELFGDEKGAFTGAGNRKPGRFELADGGTIFLDEIGELSPVAQVKLLRVLQEREFERVGGVETIRVDLRVLSATHRDLREEIRKGKFREDLFYRLNVIGISLPALRDRKEDIPLLVEHFGKKLKVRTRKEIQGFNPEALQVLVDYPWPGNIRELENVVEQAMVLAPGPVIRVEDLPAWVFIGPAAPARPAEAAAGEGKPLDASVEALEKDLIEKALARAEGNKAEAARILGIKPGTLYYKMKIYRIELE
ncbi:MAG: sigma-54 dependent transcriptional regulator [Proteobacteria bacterium]|nr:sigma-54 dependent transcriptional regulator [Pseudomonadota bacterium]